MSVEVTNNGDCWSNHGRTFVMKVVPATSVETDDTEDQFVYVNTATITVEEDNGSKISENRGIVFHNITYEVPQRKFCCIKQPNKQLLKGISGIMSPGLNAIMGPTGSGKTSLLDILAGRKSKAGLGGVVLVDGREQPSNFRFTSGYVVQDDVVMGTLTIRENLFFSAALRLPNSMTWSGKKERVESVIEELGLTSCANTKIGNEFLRGISGGERKRTNIGMELITEPHVLFLDEPTTGLDAFTAVSVVTLLRKLSQDKNRTIILSIHQPRYSIYKQFDSLTLLSRGELVYHGPVYLALDHFHSLGYECEEHDNPADFLLDITNQCERQLYNTSDKLALEQGVNLPLAYSQSQLGQSMRNKCSAMVDTIASKDVLGKIQRKFTRGTQYATNFFWQLMVIFVRSIVNLIRNPLTSVVQVCFVTLLGLVIGILYFQLDTESNGYQNRIGAVFIVCMMMVFSNMSAVDLFIRQRVFFIHENSSGYYRVSAYFIAKILSDILPLRLIPMIPFCILTYFMIGFQMEADRFFIYFFTLFLLTTGASATVFLVSAGVGVTAVATLVIPLSFVVQMLFGGFLITRDSIPVWIRWLQYGSLFRYSIEALATNEIDGLVFIEQLNGTTFEIGGRDLLELQDFNVDWMFFDWIGLFVIICTYLSLTYLTLRLIKKNK